jgi:hypothetical protein
MESPTRVDSRSAVERFRRAPIGESRPSLRISFKGDTCPALGIESRPGELVIEATSPNGEIAEWFDDFWWTDVLNRWMNEAITVIIEPTPGAMVHPVVLHHVSMIRRVAPLWRIIGRGFPADLSRPGAIREIVRSGYHEIQLQDGAPGGQKDGKIDLETRNLDEIFAEIRREQQQIGVQRPILVRIPSGIPRKS